MHIDGYNLLPYLTGEEEKSPRKGLVYFSDDGNVLALRFDNWKVVFMEQRVQGTLQVWMEPFIPLRVPKLFNLRTDPYERADTTSNTYFDWIFENDYLIFAATAIISQFLATFEEFPPRQKAATFSIDQAVEKLQASLTEVISLYTSSAIGTVKAKADEKLPVKPAKPVTPKPAPAEKASTGLAVTGAASLMLPALGGLAMLLLAAAFMVRRRRV